MRAYWIVGILAMASPATAAAAPCSYPGKLSPQVRQLQTTGLPCKSARRTISEVRSLNDWRGAYLADTWGYASYPTGGYDQNNYLNERRFRCRYLLRGIGSKYVLVICSDLDHRGVMVTAQLHGR